MATFLFSEFYRLKIFGSRVILEVGLLDPQRFFWMPGRGLVDLHRPGRDKEGSEGSRAPQGWLRHFICPFPRDTQGAGYEHCACVCVCCDQRLG